MASSLGDSSHEPVHRHGEEHRRQDASLFDTDVHSERFCHLAIVYDLAFKVLEQGLNDVHIFLGIPLRRGILLSDSRCRLSKAFSKSTNTTYKELFHSCDRSRIWRRKKMWSLHNFHFLKPSCSRRGSLSTAVVMRRRMMRQKTLLVMGSSVMPLSCCIRMDSPSLGV